jgi:iron(III) transport system substrate-binding protein
MRFVLSSLLVFYSAGAFAAEPVTVYSARKEELIKPIFERFTEETGIPVRFLGDDAPKLIARIQAEGAASPADLLITVDVANLDLALSKGLFMPVTSEALQKNVPAIYRSADNTWFGLTMRVRAIFYNKDTVKPDELSTYEDLADPRWKGEILIRPSAHPYNQSLLANIIAVHGEKGATKWAQGFTANFARTPQGGDSDQLRAVAAGAAKLAVANSYYYGRMSVSPLPEDKLVTEKVGIFFPNQNARAGELSGAHVNISGGGVLKTAKRPEEALKLLEFLSGEEAQRMYAEANKEYPVNPRIAPDDTLAAWGTFKADATPMKALAKHTKAAARIADVAGWK